MNTHSLRLAIAFATAFVPGVVLAQDEAHQAGAPPASAEMAQCARVQPVVENIIAAAMARLDSKFPKTKKAFERAAFRAVAREVIASYAGRFPDLTVSVDGDEPVPAISVLIGRTDPYTYYKGRGVRVTPQASLEEGLDVLSARTLPRRRVLRIAWQMFGSARHVKGRDMDYHHDASHVEVTSERPFPVQVDGDVMGDRTVLSVGLARDALWVVA